MTQKISDLSLAKCLALSIFPAFLGIMGCHRLYAKRWATGIFMVLTSVLFIVSLSGLLITFFINHWINPILGISTLGIAGLEVIVLIMFFYDVVLLISIQFKDAYGAIIRPPKFTLSSTRSFSVTLFLAIHLGWFGMHRIYLGRKQAGIWMLLSGIVNACLLIAGIFLALYGMNFLGIIFAFIPVLHFIWWLEDIWHLTQFRLLDDFNLPVCRN